MSDALPRCAVARSAARTDHGHRRSLGVSAIWDDLSGDSLPHTEVTEEGPQLGAHVCALCAAELADGAALRL